MIIPAVQCTLTAIPFQGKPVLESSGNGSLTVGWSKPTRVGKSPLRGYQVEYFTNPPEMTATHHWSLAEVQEERFRLSGVNSGATVVFLVRARNEHGLSPPSLLSDRLTAGGPAGDEETEEDRGEVRRRLATKLIDWRPLEIVSSTEVILHWTVSIPMILYICVHCMGKFSTPYLPNEFVDDLDLLLKRDTSNETEDTTICVLSILALAYFFVSVRFFFTFYFGNRNLILTFRCYTLTVIRSTAFLVVTDLNYYSHSYLCIDELEYFLRTYF